MLGTHSVPQAHAESHWQSVPTYIEAIEKTIVPYKNNVISRMGLPASQHTILKHDFHHTHKDARVLELPKAHNILPLFVPAGCTDFMQECDNNNLTTSSNTNTNVPSTSSSSDNLPRSSIANTNVPATSSTSTNISSYFNNNATLSVSSNINSNNCLPSTSTSNTNASSSIITNTDLPSSSSIKATKATKKVKAKRST